ncbi:MAG TPA: hypothetical protein VGY56_05380 [Verrucomicrobiae bacterium]|nr:hypothetical protein [Verrucomicrobiae bacterium]
MNPILQFLDWLIRAHGEALLNLLTYFGIPYIAWLLGRRAGRKKNKQGNTFILVVRPPSNTLSPVSRWTFESGDDGGPFGG